MTVTAVRLTRSRSSPFPGPLRGRLVAAILADEKTTKTGLVAGCEHADDALPGPGLRHVVAGSAGLSRRRQGLQALQEHHEGEAVSDKVPVPERAPYGTLGTRRLYVDVRVLLPVPLKPPDLVRRSGGNLVHGPVSLPGKRSAQRLSGITCHPSSSSRP